jgi:CheY-like chemotaxis protein
MKNLKPKVLIVDGNAEVRENLKKSLAEKFDALFVEATNGQEALWKIKNDQFDFVFLDIHLTKMSGLDLMAYIKQNKKEIPQPKQFCLITASLSPEQKTLIESRGIHVFLKPLVLEEIFVKLQGKLPFKSVQAA